MIGPASVRFKHVTTTDLRKGLVPLIETLLDERLSINNSSNC